MRDIRGNDVYGAGCEEVFFPTNHHFQLTLNDIGDLFVDVVVFGGDAAFFYVPEDKRACLTVYHFSIKARKCLFDRDIVKVLHAQFFPKIRKLGLWISGKALLASAGNLP